MKACVVLLLSGLLLLGSVAATGWWATGVPSRSAPQPLGADAWRRAVAASVPGVAGAQVPDPATASPSDVAAFVRRLSARQRDDLVRLAPEAVGNLDGVPLTMRYAANENVLAATPTTTAERALALGTSLPVAFRAAPDPAVPGGDGGRSSGVGLLERAGAGQVRPGRTLAYDPRGDGRVVQVLGDLETAEHIAVLVPGSSWRLDNVLRWPSVRRVSPLANAVVLQRAAGPGTAVVVWLGYDAPERIDLAAIGSKRAIPGAVALRRFLRGLPPAHVSLVCHSYGTVVCGRAVAGSPVDEVIALGSPGMDATTVAGLRTPARVWAARTADDPIRLTPPVRVLGLGHGASPVDPAFGARVFRTGAATGHDQYYAEGTESLANIVRVVVGRAAEVTLR